MTGRSGERRSRGRPATTSTEEILVAAEEVGLDRLTRAAVATHLGVSAATIRHHVESAERLYSLACARVFERLETDAASVDGWQDYLREIAARFLALAEHHPGLEDYVLRGPYESSTLTQFERMIGEVMGRDLRFDRSMAHLVASRVLTLAAALRVPARVRYATGALPRDELDRVASWTLDAFLVGADRMIDDGHVVSTTPTPDAGWTHVSPLGHLGNR